MYQILCNFQPSDDRTNWKEIWKLKVPERVRHFIWILHYDRLLTNYNKSRMGFGSSMCGYCCNVVEDTLHVMRDCPLAMSLWLNVVHWSARGNFFMGDLKHWINFNMSNEVGWNNEVDWKNYWAIACHCLWYWRNKELYDDSFMRPASPINHVLKLVKDYKNADKVSRVVTSSHREMVFVGWKPPPNGWVKLNSDGSCKDNGIAGCGGIIRGSDGEWLGGFAKRIGKCSAYMAELWGVYEGLRYVRRLGFQAIEVEIDSSLVVNILNSNKIGSIMGSSLVAKIRRLLQMDCEVVVRHSYRETNRCADALADFGCSLHTNICFYESCPTQFSHLVIADALGVSVPRLISV
jgi:ribonuclease HI